MKATRPVTTERFEDHLRAHDKEHAHLAEALKHADITMNYRLDGMNELRAQLNSERGKYVDRILFDVLVERIGKLEQSQAKSSGATVAWVAAVGIVLVIVQVVIQLAGK